jgi:hypothetical protein
MPSTKTDTDAAARQPPRSDAPADAAAGAQDAVPGGDGANQGSPAAPVMKQFAKTEAESGGDRK